MLSVGKQTWLSKAVLAVYLLLVCFGHALHALPGHQHGGCGCPDSHEHAKGDVCSHGEAVEQASACSLNHQPTAVDCPFGHKTETSLASVPTHQKVAKGRFVPENSDANWQDVGCHDLCLICELLAAPQAALAVQEVESATLPLEPSHPTIYAFYGVDVPFCFSARGPPSVRT